MFEELLESGFADLIEALLRGVAFGRKNYLALIYRDVETVITGRLRGVQHVFCGFSSHFGDRIKGSCVTAIARRYPAGGN